MRCSLVKSAVIAAAAGLFTLVPLMPRFGPAVVWAANGNGNGNAGGNGNGHSDNGNANDHGDSADHANSHANGQDGVDQAPGQALGTRPVTAMAGAKPGTDDPLAPSRLGRLNAFFHASPSARSNASPHSAVGAVSKTYDHVMLSYLNNTGATLDDVAAALARAANKPLNPSVVAAINTRLNVYAGIDPSQVGAGYASTTDINVAVTNAANTSFATKSSQGLGSN